MTTLTTVVILTHDAFLNILFKIYLCVLVGASVLHSNTFCFHPIVHVYRETNIYLSEQLASGKRRFKEVEKGTFFLLSNLWKYQNN